MSILALTSDTLIGTAGAGQIEYNGQFFGTDSNASRAQLQRIVRTTAVTASGTSVNFTDIPAWVKRITMMLNGVSTSGSASYLIQIGPSGGIETTGYDSMAGLINTANNLTRGQGSTSGYILQGSTGTATYAPSGAITLVNITSNVWLSSGNLADLNAAGANVLPSAGTKSLAGTLTQVRLTTTNGTDTFDAGSVNILYEG